MDRSARRRSKSDLPSPSLRAASLSSPRTPGRNEACRRRSGIPKARSGTSQLCSRPRGALTWRAGGSQPGPGAAGPRPSLPPPPAGCSSSHECPKLPAPQEKPPAPLPRATCAVGRPCPPGTPASRPELRGSGGSGPARGARLRRERAEGAERCRPHRCGREYTDWIHAGSGRGRRGLPAFKSPSRYKMLLSVEGRRC